jgi:hypothetical protein
MKDRRPRKLKKKLKVKYQAVIALKMVRTALTSAQSAFRVAMINSSFGTPMPEKALAILETIKDAAFSIQSIMSEKPTSWKEC